MKSIKVYAIGLALIVCTARNAAAITVVYGQNKTQFPAQLETVIHYLKKKQAIKPGLLGATRAQETKNIPLTSFMTALAQANTIATITVNKATLDTPTGPVVIPINYMFTLNEAAPSAETRCGVITINSDMTFTVLPDTNQCFFASF